MIVIGVTGNFGSGKSTVCRVLAGLGSAVIDADRLAHETYRPHSRTWQELIDAFGRDVLGPGGEIDRPRLGQIVFSDHLALAHLNRIVHPAAYRLARQRIEDFRLQGAPAVALEATLLIEAGWADLVDRVWLVTAPRATVVRRLKQKHGIGDDQVIARLESQMPTEQKAKHADDTIHNNGTVAELESRVIELWNRLRTG
jgi:dephospho-CoA kinase